LLELMVYLSMEVDLTMEIESINLIGIEVEKVVDIVVVAVKFVVGVVVVVVVKVRILNDLMTFVRMRKHPMPHDIQTLSHSVPKNRKLLN